MINSSIPVFDFNPIHPNRQHFHYSLDNPELLPVVTIVTPFFNNGQLFLQTAKSILQQSLQQFEWLIINNGSNELESQQILDQYRQKDNRIRVIDQNENYGLSAAWNTGFRFAQTEYVVLLKSDILLEPTTIEKWWWFLETYPQFGFVDSYSVETRENNSLRTGGFWDGEENAKKIRIPAAFMIRKSIHRSVDGFDESIENGKEVWDFLMRCAGKGTWGSTIPEFLIWSDMQNIDPNQSHKNDLECIPVFLDRYKNEFPQLYNGQFPAPSLRNFELDLILPSLEIPLVNRIVKPHRRLLLILPWLVMGGAERFTLNLMDQLINQKWEISVVATAPIEHLWLYEFEKRSEDVFILPHFLPIKDYPHYLGYLIQSRQYDVVMVQGSIEGYRLLPILRKLFPALPLIDYIHSVLPDWMKGGFARLSVLFKDYLNLSIVSSKQVFNWLIAEGVEKEKLEVCYIGVDDKVWKPDQIIRQQVRSKMGIARNEVVILFAARLEKEKQPFFMIDIIEELLNQRREFRLLIAGDGSLRSVMQKRISESNLEKNVSMLGSLSSKEMIEIMAAVDIFLLPSQVEGIAQTIYEAMACELVVVGAKVGGQTELVTEECGFLVEIGDEYTQREDYVRILSDLIDNSQLRQSLGANARKRIEDHFSLDRMGNCINGKLESLIIGVEPEKESSPITKEICEETRTIVEFLQARQESLRLYKVVEDISNQYNDLYNKFEEITSPKPPSHWFYLWIRQLSNPIYTWLIKNKYGSGVIIRTKNLFRKLFLRK
jgi:glycosyltransferase involved in cell wall biosynthesis